MAPYWASLPLAQSSNPLKGAHLLQDDLLASTMIMHDAYTRNVFEGGKPELVQRSAEELSRLSVEEFLQLVRVVGPPRHAAEHAMMDTLTSPNVLLALTLTMILYAWTTCTRELYIRALTQTAAVNPQDEGSRVL